MKLDVWSELLRHRRLYPKDEGRRQKIVRWNIRGGGGGGGGDFAKKIIPLAP